VRVGIQIFHEIKKVLLDAPWREGKFLLYGIRLELDGDLLSVVFMERHENNFLSLLAAGFLLLGFSAAQAQNP
jgi:hypothetical protein